MSSNKSYNLDILLGEKTSSHFFFLAAHNNGQDFHKCCLTGYVQEVTYEQGIKIIGIYPFNREGLEPGDIICVPEIDVITIVPLLTISELNTLIKEPKKYHFFYTKKDGGSHCKTGTLKRYQELKNIIYLTIELDSEAANSTIPITNIVAIAPEDLTDRIDPK